MYNTSTSHNIQHWLILALVDDAGDSVVPFDNISHIVSAEEHAGAFVYLKSHGYAIETTMSVKDIIETMRKV